MNLTVTGTMGACRLITVATMPVCELIAVPFRARLNEDDYFFVIRFFFHSIHLHLIGRTVNNEAGSFKQNSKTPNSTRRSSELLCSISSFNLGSLSNSTWHVP